MGGVLYTEAESTETGGSASAAAPKPTGPPTLAKPVTIADLTAGDPAACAQFRSDFRNLGFGVIEISDSMTDLAKQYRALGSQWFENIPLTEKKKFEAKAKDDLFAELGRKPNAGYVLTEQKKEYLKYKMTPEAAGVSKDIPDSEIYPTEDIKTAVHNILDAWRREYAYVALRILADEQVKCEEKIRDPSTDKWTGEMKTVERALIDNDDVTQIEKFANIHGSITLIHYFKNEEERISELEARVKGDSASTSAADEEKKEEEEQSEDSVLQELEDLRKMHRTTDIPLGEHVDTGILTAIIASDVCGLDILDRRTEVYFPSEDHYTPFKHMIVTPGRKMELFSYRSKIEPCWHRVRIDPTKERYSLLYFMEVQKDH